MKGIAVLAILGYVAVVYGHLDTENTAPESVKCPVPNSPNVTLIPNPVDCTSYYACNTGIPVKMPCPPGLHFNKNESACDWPVRACCDPAYDPENKCPKFA